MDESLDELLEEYGEIVYSRGDASPIAEVNDDAESLSCMFIFFLSSIGWIMFIIFLNHPILHSIIPSFYL